MRYRTYHRTTYVYGEQVSMCHNQVRLTPRSGPEQSVTAFHLDVSPRPEAVVSHTDYFGNTVHFFCIHEAHGRLEVIAEALVDVTEKAAPDLSASPAWESAREQTREHVDAIQFIFDSTFIRGGDEFRAYAEPSFLPGRPLLEAANELCSRIYADFRYQPYTTQIDTPVETALRNRGGVCQDFAQVMIAGLRSMGISARYVSGYIRSGQDRVGAEASHAWVSVFCPRFGWTDFDPTNNRMVLGGDHVTLAWGRDYTDVTPVKGVIVGGGEHLVHVSVGVVPA